MATKWEVATTRSDVFLFDPTDIVIKPELNGRYEAPDIEGLIESILANGQIQPVTVRMENGRPVLTAGFSRWTAISEINKRKLTPERFKIKCVYARVNEVDGYILNFEENRARNATTPMDDAHHFAQLEKWSMTVEQIAERLKLTPAFVRDRLALIEAMPEVQAAVASGQIKPTAAKRLAKLSAQQQREVVKSNGHKITTKDVDKASGKTSKPSYKDVRSYIESHTGPGEDESVREFCISLLAYMSGE
jgi:ParB/RepB/Spo0J family partition protein